LGSSDEQALWHEKSVKKRWLSQPEMIESVTYEVKHEISKKKKKKKNCTFKYRPVPGLAR
jgi:hypothetical protein